MIFSVFRSYVSSEISFKTIHSACVVVERHELVLRTHTGLIFKPLLIISKIVFTFFSTSVGNL